MGVAHSDTFFAQAGPKNGNFYRFYQIIFRTTGLQLNLLILIKFPHIFHWKPAKKKKSGCGLGAKFVLRKKYELKEKHVYNIVTNNLKNCSKQLKK